jgi:hypothetical protein
MNEIRVAVLADDLIWATRLRDLIAGTSARPVPCRTMAALAEALPAVDAVVVDLSARSFDPVSGIAEASRATRRVLAVGPHDDAVARDRARAAGAERVLAYRALAEAGPVAIARWLGADPRADALPPADDSTGAVPRADPIPR